MAWIGTSLALTHAYCSVTLVPWKGKGFSFLEVTSFSLADYLEGFI